METTRTVKFTGEPVSEKMLNILERLERNENVMLEEIENTKEITIARGIVNYSTPTIFLKNREEIRKHVLNTLMESGSAGVDENGNVFYNKDVKRNARLDIVIGLPASGKSSALCDTISEEFGSRLIDNDEAKKLLPEYNNGWGADIVHKESQLISDEQFNKCVGKKENIVLPKVGGDYDKLNKYIEYAKKNGYKVYVHYVEIKRNKALGRMLNRFLDAGRFLPPDLIEKYDNLREGNKILATYEKLKGGNEYGKINTSTTKYTAAPLRDDKGYGGSERQIYGIFNKTSGYMGKNDGRRTVGDGNQDIFGGNRTIEEPLVDGFSRWNNEVSFGEKPILMEAGCSAKFIDEGKKNTIFMKAIQDLKNEITTAGFPSHYEPYVESIIQHTALAYQENHDIPRTDIIIGYDNPKQDISFLTAGMNIVIKSMDTNTQNVAEDVKNICNTYRELGFEEIRFHFINDSKRLMCPQKNGITSGEITFNYVKHSCLADGYTCHIAKESNCNQEIKPTVDVNGYSNKVQSNAAKELKRQ